MTERRTKKENEFEKRFGVTTIVISGKLWKTIKIKVCEKPNFWVGSRLCVAKGVSTLQHSSKGSTFN